MNSPRPNVVSRRLRLAGFTRSTTTRTRSKGLPLVTPGYSVTTQDGRTQVTYTLGNTGPAHTPERRRELVSAVVYAMEKALSQRYTVDMFEPTEGVAYRLTLS